MSKFIEFAKDRLEEEQYMALSFGKFDDKTFLLRLNQSISLGHFLNACFAYLRDSPNYDIIPEKCLTILNRKAYDYSSKDNRYSNFEIANKWAENLLNHLNNDALKIVSDNKASFAYLMGTKVARLTELLTSNKEPNNESIEDSVLDFMNYRLLLEGYMLGLQ